MIVSEDDERTYSAKLETNGMVTAKLFVERGGTSVVTDDSGDTYISGGQVYIYDPAGKQIGTLEIPERPGILAFGGADHHTLLIAARSSRYAIQIAATGR